MQAAPAPPLAPVRGSRNGGSRNGPVRRIHVTRVSTGHVVMVVAGLLGMVFALAALRTGPDGTPVAVAAHEIRAGATVHRRDFRFERVSMSPALLAHAVTATEMPRLRGRIAGMSILEGELVSRQSLRPRSAKHGLRSMSIPVDPARAVSGRLARGDRVDVIFTDSHQVSIIVSDAAVIAVDARGRGGIEGSTSAFTVTIAVSTSQSQTLAAAIADGNLSIARTTGALSSEGTPPRPLDALADAEAR
jgi:Flp pilus assembly protein CpaB